MLLKKKSITPGQRHLVLIDKSFLAKNAQLLKKYTKGLTKKGGRNNRGRITVRHQGGGHKRIYRQLDFKYQFKDKKLISIEYDPNRSSFIGRARILENNEDCYILLPHEVKINDIFYNATDIDEELPIHTGNSLFLKNLPIGIMLHNLEISPGKGGQFIRSAGTFGQILQKQKNYVLIQLPSGEKRLFSNNCKCTIGRVSNIMHQHQKLGKAGRNRWLNKRPSVRGVAMNPIDHPHGGGEGKTSGGRPSSTPWGKITKGQPTRKKSKKNFLIVEKRLKNKKIKV